MLFDVFETAALAGLKDSVDGKVLFWWDNVVDAAYDVGVVQALQDIQGPDEALVFVVLFELSTVILLEGILLLWVGACVLVTLLRMR